MSRADKEGVLSRWSRLKRESARVTSETEESTKQAAANLQSGTEDAGEVDPPGSEGEALAELPSLDELGPDSDFQGFMNPKVDDGLRRAALKKLFSDPHFNVTDGLDVYAEDYTQLESMTPAMVAGLKHAQRLLFGDVEGDKRTDTARQTDILERPATNEQAIVQGKARTAHAQDREGEDGEGGNGEAGDGEPENSAAVIPPPEAENPKA